MTILYTVSGQFGTEFTLEATNHRVVEVEITQYRVDSYETINISLTKSEVEDIIAILTHWRNSA